MQHDKLDPRTQTEGKSEDAHKSTAVEGKVPPSLVDSKVGVEDQEPGKQIDRDVEAAHRDPSRGRPDEATPPPKG